jgi:ribosomal protein L11 methyltransferase
MWTELLFTVPGGDAEAWSDALLEAGALSVQAEDADADSPDEQALFGEPGEPAPAASWSRTRLTVLLGASQDAQACLANAAALCARIAPSEIAQRSVADQDWVRLTQSQFEPIAVGRRLVISPSWHLDAGRADTGGREVLRLDPGLAFGTGSHPTTRMCLEWLDASLKSGSSVIDYGCGSGILAIAAARLGASPVTAIDIDLQAVESARHNALANEVPIRVQSAQDPLPEPADVVLANILANPLRVLAPLLTGLVRQGGVLVLAGLLERQAQELCARYPEVSLDVVDVREGWACLAGIKR